MRSGRGAGARSTGTGESANQENDVIQGGVRSCVDVEELLVHGFRDEDSGVATRGPVLCRGARYVSFPAIQAMHGHHVRVQEFSGGHLPLGGAQLGFTGHH